jgi:hypothetical protein
MHSYRIRLAARLRAAGARDGRIQAYCRWQCPESLHIYARWDFDEYENWLRKARRTKISSTEVANLPALDHGAELGLLAPHLRRKRLKKLVAPDNAADIGSFAKPKNAAAAPATRKPKRRAGGSPQRCQCGGVTKVPRFAPPVGSMAVWTHADARCFWTYVCPGIGSFKCRATAEVALRAALASPRSSTPSRPAPARSPSPNVCVGIQPGLEVVSPARRTRSPVPIAIEIAPPSSGQRSKDLYDGQCGMPGCTVASLRGRHKGPHILQDGTRMLN